MRLRKAFVALQVALSLLLLIGAGLFVRTLDNLRKVDLGFKTENVAMFGVRPATQYDDARKLQVFRTLIESLATVPGVKAVGANTSRLLTGGRWDSQITHSRRGDQGWQRALELLQRRHPRLLRGAGHSDQSGPRFHVARLGRVAKAVSRQRSAREGLPRRARTRSADRSDRAAAWPPDTEIIGVFGNARYHDVRGEVPRQTFVNLDSRIRNVGSVTVYARMQGDPRLILPMLREQVRRVDSNLVVFDMRMMDDQLNMRLANERMLSFLSGGFALLATILAIVGLHGVLAFVVTRRTREIGIRMALGARQGTVVRLVMREMLVVILLGLAAGVAAAYLCGSYVETQLFGVKAVDWPVFALSVATLLAASLVASFAPAWRASRISPVRALHYE